jgi:RNA 2',3'-cyclic 3'-phosphodiesterase
MGETTRSFIAIALNEQIHKELEQLQNKLKTSNADVKWVAPENIHITLKFLGNITDKQIEQVKDSIKEIASNLKQYNIHFATIGGFPTITSPRVVWVGMDEGVDETSDIYDAIEEQLTKIGFNKEKRPFSPHLTLGRVRSPNNRQRLTEIMEREKGFSSSLRLLVREVILFKSTLTPKGPVYDAIFKASLAKA